jgi:hypothetical protein
LLGSDHRLYSHIAQFYLEDDFLLSVLGDLVEGALQSGNAAVIVATPAHERALAQRLWARGLDVAALRSQGTYAALDAVETLSYTMAEGDPDFFRFRQRIGRALAAAAAASPASDPRVMVFGEMVALLWARRNLQACLAVERFWAILARSFSFSLLCAYPIREFAEAGTEKVFVRICGAHETVIPPDAYATRESEIRIWEATAQSYAATLTQARHGDYRKVPPQAERGMR